MCLEFASRKVITLTVAQETIVPASQILSVAQERNDAQRVLEEVQASQLVSLANPMTRQHSVQ